MRLLASLCVVFVSLSCGPPPPPASEPQRDLDREACVAAVSFWRCFEREGAECRHPQAPYRAWSALAALTAVRDRSPVVLIDELTRAFTDLRDDSRPRRAFIAELARREHWARTAGCEVLSARPLGATIDGISQAARARIERLGLGDTAPGSAVGELAEAAAGVRETREVRLGCSQNQSFYVIVAPGSGDAWHPVGVGETPVLAGAAAEEVAPLRLGASLNEQVDLWLPFGEDQL
jgi:hypothetical protein